MVDQSPDPTFLGRGSQPSPGGDRPPDAPSALPTSQAPTSAPSTPSMSGWQTGPTTGPQLGSSAQPGGGWQSGSATTGRLRPVGPILMLLGALTTVVSLFVPWYATMMGVDDPSGGLRWVETGSTNAFEQADVVSGNNGPLGTLFVIALIVACAAVVVVLVSVGGTVTTQRRSNAMAMIGLIGAVLGFIATVGLLIGFVAMAGDGMKFGPWMFGLSFVPVLIGALGTMTKKF